MPDKAETSTRGQDESSDKGSLIAVYRFATGMDFILLPVGCIACAATGIAAPIRMLFLGDWFDTAGASEAGVGDQMPMDTTMTMVMSLIYVGTGLLIARAISEACLKYSRERQILRLKQAYVRAIVRQDIGWYDTSRPEELSTRIGESVSTVTAGLASPLAEPMEAVTALTFGWILAFSKNWAVALVILGIAPMLFMSIAVLLKTTKGAVQKIQDAYAEAGSLASEALSQMRTVAALGLEKSIAEQYEGKLDLARQVSTRFSFIAGLSNASFVIAPPMIIGTGARGPRARHVHLYTSVALARPIPLLGPAATGVHAECTVSGASRRARAHVPPQPSRSPHQSLGMRRDALRRLPAAERAAAVTVRFDERDDDADVPGGRDAHHAAHV